MNEADSYPPELYKQIELLHKKAQEILNKAYERMLQTTVKEVVLTLLILLPFDITVYLVQGPLAEYLYHKQRLFSDSEDATVHTTTLDELPEISPQDLEINQQAQDLLLEITKNGVEILEISDAVFTAQLKMEELQAVGEDVEAQAQLVSAQSNYQQAQSLYAELRRQLVQLENNPQASETHLNPARKIDKICWNLLKQMKNVMAEME